MALYKYPQVLGTSNDAAFDQTHGPGGAAPYAGIYRCTNCGDEISIAGGNVLPPQNHRQHNPANGHIRWQLIVHSVSQA